MLTIMFSTDKTSRSRHDRTPSHSPSKSPHPKRKLWTPPTKVITNPRLNQISSPVGMVPSNTQSPLNKTPPKMQSLQTLSQMVSASPTNLQTGINIHFGLVFETLINCSFLSIISVSYPLTDFSICF